LGRLRRPAQAVGFIPLNYYRKVAFRTVEANLLDHSGRGKDRLTDYGPGAAHIGRESRATCRSRRCGGRKAGSNI